MKNHRIRAISYTLLLIILIIIMALIFFMPFYSKRIFRKSIESIVELIKYDKDKDIAVLKITDDKIKVRPIKLGASDKLYFGDKVYAVGNGSNYGLAFTQGIISIPRINIEYEEITREVIQSDITIASGNSGDALLDERGRLIGITSFRTKDEHGNVIYGFVYSIPIEIVMEYVNN